MTNQFLGDSQHNFHTSSASSKYDSADMTQTNTFTLTRCSLMGKRAPLTHWHHHCTAVNLWICESVTLSYKWLAELAQTSRFKEKIHFYCSTSICITCCNSCMISVDPECEKDKLFHTFKQACVCLLGSSWLTNVTPKQCPQIMRPHAHVLYRPIHLARTKPKPPETRQWNMN